jgi:hypothetical protein
MNMLAALFNIPDDEREFGVFSFHNQDQHFQVVNAIAATKDVTLPLFPLDPIPLQDLEGWANIHQAAHNDVNGALGLAGFDLSSIDVNNPAEFAAFIQLHAKEHVLWASMLGLS